MGTSRKTFFEAAAAAATDIPAGHLDPPRQTTVKQTQRSTIRGIFIGLQPKQAGYLIYLEDRMGTTHTTVSHGVSRSMNASNQQLPSLTSPSPAPNTSSLSQTTASSLITNSSTENLSITPKCCVDAWWTRSLSIVPPVNEDCFRVML